MCAQSPLSAQVLKLQSQKTRYNKAVALLCRNLDGHNKNLLQSMIKDLVYHFSPGLKGQCRSGIVRDQKLWNADSYTVLADRYSKLLGKKISSKTVQRYTDILKSAGILETSRHFFNGTNVLHRTVDAYRLEQMLFTAELSAFDSAVSEKEVKEREMRKLHDLLKGIKLRGLEKTGQVLSPLEALDARTELDKKDEVEAVIVAGHSLFQLGKLLNTTKKPTQQARAKIRQLVELGILSEDAVYCLKDGVERGCLKHLYGNDLGLKPRYWPQWLDQYYPYADDHGGFGLAVDYLDYRPEIAQLLEGKSLERYNRCCKLMDDIVARKYGEESPGKIYAEDFEYLIEAV